MTWEADLFTTLKALVNNRVYPVVFPQPPAKPVWPSLRYTFVDTVPIQDQCGDGDDSTSDTRVQIDVVTSASQGYPANRALRLQVLQVMLGFPVPARLELSSEQFDAETQTYRTSLDYSLHGSSA